MDKTTETQEEAIALISLMENATMKNDFENEIKKVKGYANQSK